MVTVYVKKRTLGEKKQGKRVDLLQKMAYNYSVNLWIREGCPVQKAELIVCLEQNPVIAAIGEDKWDEALNSPVEVLFYLSANLLSVSERIRQAHETGKHVLVHLDLAEGIGRDRAGIKYLAQIGVDGIISTRAQAVQLAKEQGLITVQRFFLLDSKGIESIEEMLRHTNPHFMELMPGVISKSIRRFGKVGIPVIAGGLIETKAELMEALSCGATAVSTGRKDLWYM